MTKKGQELFDKLIHNKPKGEEWLEFEKEVLYFLHNEATDEEVERFMQYTEMLSMTCRAIENMQRKNNVDILC